MAVTPVSFRESFPEFASLTLYPPQMVQFWLDVAVQFVNEARWATLTDLGVSLFAAHQITLQAKAQKSAAFGQTPGQNTGILTSKSIDGVSASYDVSTATLQDAGHWNLSTYGVRYLQMARMMGMGPISVEGHSGAVSVSAAWPGVFHQQGW